MLWQNGLNMVQFLWSSLWEKMRRKKKDGLIFKTTHDKHDFGLRSPLYGVTKCFLPYDSFYDIHMYVSYWRKEIQFKYFPAFVRYINAIDELKYKLYDFFTDWNNIRISSHPYTNNSLVDTFWFNLQTNS